MHYQYWPHTINVPASTPSTSPVTQSYKIIQGHLKSIRIRTPAGHAGRTGIRLVYQGTQIFPWELTGFWVSDNEVMTVEWEDEIMATGLQVEAYNTDLTQHSFYMLAEVWPSVTPAPAAVEGTPNTRANESSVLAAIAELKSTRE